MSMLTAETYPASGALPAPFWRAHLLPVVLGCALLTLFSKISIPLQPVPISLQTVAVMLIGLLYTRSNAIQTVATYLALGALGLPVFASSAKFGLPVLIGPTGGFLMGFLAAVAIMTFMRDKWLNQARWLHHVALCSVGTGVIFAMGIAWLTCLIGLEKALAVGFLPFVLPAIVKVAILTSMLKLYQTAKRAQ